MTDQAYTFTNKPTLVGAAGHHGVMDTVAQQVGLLQYLHDEKLVRWSDYYSNGVPVSTTSAGAISAGQALHSSGHSALADFQIKHFREE